MLDKEKLLEYLNWSLDRAKDISAKTQLTNIMIDIESSLFDVELEPRINEIERLKTLLIPLIEENKYKEVKEIVLLLRRTIQEVKKLIK